MDGFPPVRVVLVGRDDHRRLGHCLTALLAQDYPGELEILFAAADAATDTVAEVRAETPDITVTRPTGETPPFGQAWAQGEVLAFLDAGFEIAPDWLATFVRPFVGGTGTGPTEAALVLAGDRGRVESLDAAAAGRWVAGHVPSGNGTGPAWWARAFALRADRVRRLGRLEEPFLRNLENADVPWDEVAIRLVTILAGPAFDSAPRGPGRRRRRGIREQDLVTKEAESPDSNGDEHTPTSDPPFSRFGILIDDGERVQCHLCGRYFGNLGTHSARTHGLPAAGYRRRFGLRARTSLLGPTLRERRRAQARARVGTPAFARFLEAGRRAHTVSPPRQIEAAGIVAGNPVAPSLDRPERFALAALAVLVLAEVVTAFGDVRWGVALHAMLLALLAIRGARDTFAAGIGGPSRLPSFACFATALALAPLTRIVSLALPLTEFPQTAWYAIVAAPMLVAAWAAARANGYDRRDLGLSLDQRPGAIALAIAVGASGVAVGYVEYRVLAPDPLIDRFALLPFLAVSASLAFGTGFTEEVIFRGVLQRASIDLLGGRAGIAYAAAVFAILHVGHRSALDVGFVFLVALGFGVVVRATRSLVGVIVAHSLTNVCLFLVFPLLDGR